MLSCSLVVIIGRRGELVRGRVPAGLCAQRIDVPDMPPSLLLPACDGVALGVLDGPPTRCGVQSIATSVTPRWRSASSTPLTMAGVAAMVPASPTPLTPNGFDVAGV